MLEEARPGVSGASSPEAQGSGVNNASSPGANGQPGADTAAGATDPNATGNRPGPVPYERFHQVNEERNRLAAERAAVETYARQLQGAVTELQGRINAQSAQPASQPDADPLEQVVVTRLGNDETGQAARETIAAVVQLELKKALKGTGGGGINKDEIMQIVNGAVAQALAPNAINSQLYQWKAEGRISDADIPVISQEMLEMIAAQPGWGQGENVKLLPIMALGNAVAKGRLKPAVSASPGTSFPPGTPLQPGGPSSPVTDTGDTLRVAEAVISRFPRLSKVDPQVLAKRFGKTPLDPHHGEIVIGGRR